MDRVRSAVQRPDLVIAADGGLVHAAALGIAVDVLVGDLDSAPPDLVAEAEAAGTTIERHPVDKDETDLELALAHAAAAAPGDVVMVGLLGGRIDHELANLALAAQRVWFEAGLRIVIDDGVRTIYVVHDRLELTEPPGTTISVLPWLGDATGVRERGMRWDLADATLNAGTPRGMSNVADDATQEISLTNGVLLVIVDRAG